MTDTTTQTALFTHKTTAVRKDPIKEYDRSDTPSGPSMTHRHRDSGGDRYTRYSRLVPPQTLKDQHCVVIGVGAAGRQVAIQLAAIGIGSMTLYDADVVDPVNLGPQAYPPSMLGKPKVHATKLEVKRLNPEVRVSAHPKYLWRVHFWRNADGKTVEDPGEVRWPQSATTVFICVDFMESRRVIFEKLVEMAPNLNHPLSFLDVRMSIETVRVITLPDLRDKEDVEYYKRTLFRDSEGFQQPCTARATNYTAAMGASWMLAQFTKILRKQKQDDMPKPRRDFYIDVLGEDMYNDVYVAPLGDAAAM